MPGTAWCLVCQGFAWLYLPEFFHLRLRFQSMLEVSPSLWFGGCGPQMVILGLLGSFAHLSFLDLVFLKQDRILRMFRTPLTEDGIRLSFELFFSSILQAGYCYHLPTCNASRMDCSPMAEFSQVSLLARIQSENSISGDVCSASCLEIKTLQKCKCMLQADNCWEALA